MDNAEKLSEAQQRRLSVTCAYIDKLLCEMEQILNQAASESPFPRHIIDVTPAQRRVIEDHVRRLRQQLMRSLAWQGLKPDPADIPASRAVISHLGFIDIAIEELKPSYMNECGALPQTAEGELNGIVHELRSIVEGVERYLRQESRATLSDRLTNLEKAGKDVGLLKRIEATVTRHGLVEFRSRITSITSRLEDDQFEVALFGRVSSGKSSLLNALLGTDLLPVGVNPITAVPTKLRFGRELRTAVTFGDGRNQELNIGDLISFVTESGNPGNVRNVVRALVQVPSPRLRDGIVLVDTPGLGSLARHGAQEALAYLPSCDLALLLIDASVALNEEDVGTLRLLNEAGIPSIVLISKADLLTRDDQDRVSEYTETQIRRELGLDAEIKPVSALPAYTSLLDEFFAETLQPRFDQARSLRDASVARKIGALREAVVAALETSARRSHVNLPGSVNPQSAEQALRRITGVVGAQRSRLDRAFLELGERSALLLDDIVEAVFRHCSETGEREVSITHLAEFADRAVQRRVHEVLIEARAELETGIDELSNIARALGRRDSPTADEIATLFRDVPRFELGTAPAAMQLGQWNWLGNGVLRRAIKNKLANSIGRPLAESLHRYGRAVTHWGELMNRKAQTLVNSYADAYRAQLLRTPGSPDAHGSTDDLDSDLDALKYGLEDGVLTKRQGAA